MDRDFNEFAWKALTISDLMKLQILRALKHPVFASHEASRCLTGAENSDLRTVENNTYYFVENYKKTPMNLSFAVASNLFVVASKGVL